MNENETISPREEEIISRIVKTAYPSPSTDIAAHVMEKISVIKASRKKRTSLFIRYGSIAACAIIIAGISLKVIPAMSGKSADNNTAVMTASDDAAPMEVYSMKSIEKADCDIEIEEECCAENGAAIKEEPARMFDLAETATTADKPEETEKLSGNRSVFGGALGFFMQENQNKLEYKYPSVYALEDIDGDGESEYCVVTSVPEPEFELHVTASVGNEIKYEAVFPTSPCSVNFEKSNGQMILREKDSATGEVTYYAIVADENHIKLKQIG